MKATRDEIRQCVMESIKELLLDNQSVVIEDTTDPIRHLGFDSFDGVAFACALSEKLGYFIPAEINPFVDDEGQKSRCLMEIVDVVFLLIEREEKRDE